MFYLSHGMSSALGPTQPRIQWVLRVISPGVKRPWREVDNLPLSSIVAKNAWSYISTPQYVFKAR